MPRGVYPRKITPLAVRFWRHVQKTDGCWSWTGACGPHGRGQINAGDRTVLASHVAWELSHGTWPTSNVLHTCDNPNCVRPDHLFEGSQAVNLADMAKKGRSCRGTKNWNHKLREDWVAKARILHRFGLASCNELATICQVAWTTMRDALTGKKWKHVC